MPSAGIFRPAREGAGVGGGPKAPSTSQAGHKTPPAGGESVYDWDDL